MEEIKEDFLTIINTLLAIKQETANKRAAVKSLRKKIYQKLIVRGAQYSVDGNLCEQHLTTVE